MHAPSIGISFLLKYVLYRHQNKLNKIYISNFYPSTLILFGPQSSRLLLSSTELPDSMPFFTFSVKKNKKQKFLEYKAEDLGLVRLARKISAGTRCKIIFKLYKQQKIKIITLKRKYMFCITYSWLKY